jgi:hypothetical protein
MRVLLARCAAKMMNRVVSGAFNRWLEMTEEAKEMRLKVGLSVQVEPATFPATFSRRSQLFCLCSLPIALESAWFQPLRLRSEKPVSKLAFKSNLYRYIKVNRTLRKMMNRQMSGAFETWHGPLPYESAKITCAKITCCSKLCVLLAVR